ncbi:clotting factor G beta subunit-like [Drosophila ficusphila]|uniref:clotting factor G beta subunit-like n=1 Tax=Drosophila ficusphila TaxID=30025 RepID=UPI0007E6DC93|nr:clotting factor G beta subunit-like [Drosophila ficusphila]
MRELVALVLIALALSQFANSRLLDENCSGKAPVQLRMVGAQLANPNTTTWMASLHNLTHFVCGATLIHKSFVLTAAHCPKLGDVRTVHVGEYDLMCSSKDCTHVERRNVAEVFYHPNYNKQTFHYDIALLRLDRDVIFNKYIKPICIILDEGVSSKSVDQFSIFGWGKTETDLISDKLKWLTLNNEMDHTKCESDGVKKICAGRPDKADACHGDSGGPLAAPYNYNGKYRFVQFGIISFGSEYCDGYGVYTDVLAYRDFIASIVLENEPRLLTENCKSDWGGGVYLRLWEMSHLKHTFPGGLITNRFVLTVASAFPPKISKITVETEYLGSFDVDWVHRHPNYTLSSQFMKNNIAVVKLSKEVPNSDLLKPICFRLNTGLPTIFNAFMYFQNSILGAHSESLEKVEDYQCSIKTGMTIGPNQICVKRPKGFSFDIPGSFVGTFQTILGSEKYLFAGMLSHAKNGIYLITNVQSQGKWIEYELLR